jgi:hypothetical protein
MNKGNHNSLSFVVSMMLFTVFALFLTLVLMTGASSFQSVSDGVRERFEERTPLFYVSQKIRASDRTDAVRITEVNGIQALVLTEPFNDEDLGISGEILIYIYEHGGFLKEFYAFDDSPPNLQIGTAVFPAESISFGFVTDSLLKVEINGESLYINLSAADSSSRTEVAP